MNIEKDKVVTFHYRLSDDKGNEIENSQAQEPLSILYGHGNIIPGLEKALEEHGAGDSLQVEIPPAEGYGERQEGQIQRVPKKYFQNGARLKVGDTTVLALKQGGQRVVTVHKVGMSAIDVDLNHPMAGKTLHFDVTVNEVRDGSEEEIQHGHAHPPGAEAH